MAAHSCLDLYFHNSIIRFFMISPALVQHFRKVTLFLGVSRGWGGGVFVVVLPGGGGGGGGREGE